VNPEAKAGNDGWRAKGIRLSILLVVVWTFMANASVTAESLETVIGPPKEPLQAGKAGEFSVYIHNVGEADLSVRLPAQISCSIKSDGYIVDVEAMAHEGFHAQVCHVCGK
jgi:hypothetical protein